MNKLFKIALMISVAYMFVLVVSTVEAKSKGKKKKRYVSPSSATLVCYPKVTSITQNWDAQSGSDIINIRWNCTGVSYTNCDIFVAAHVYLNGQPYPPDDPINHKFNNIWTDEDGLSCGIGKVTTLFVFLGNLPPGNYSCDVDVYNGTSTYHSFDAIATNMYNWVIQ